ncbi:hypothetical protein [Pantoea phytobeneficialis]|uniref:N-acetyltransferase n=2 Tax=Pantoea phytobeneficialis TaxID=2052056 RepID=A0AAP9H4L1_9GAMM|nr:hypothetical protein [Pantoea phytobeneficialis]MDO6406079.1 hypothetical protein [Pantoea phytobeneficialis]QGR06605.1 hypothetical protein CTZ24_09350 [Pantoea phytobeneficialis]
MKCRHAKDSDLDKVCDLLAKEFCHDPIYKVLFSGRDDRVNILRDYFRIYVNIEIYRKGTLLSENDTDVLVYIRPEFIAEIVETHAQADEELRKVCGSSYKAASELINGLDRLHPLNPPHYFISLQAVQRSARGGEVVESLFRTLHDIIDKDKLPCYAECTRFSTRTLIRRWGYRDADFPLHIRGFPDLYPVWRDPKQLSMK